MKTYPEPVVGAFIVNSKNEILLVQSSKWGSGQIWSVPGGHIEIGETIANAVQRETLEEVGLKVDFQNIICVWENIYPKDFHETKHFIFLECYCTVSDSDFNYVIDNNEITQAKWFTIEDALKQKLETYTQKTLLKIPLVLNKK